MTDPLKVKSRVAALDTAIELLRDAGFIDIQIFACGSGTLSSGDESTDYVAEGDGNILARVALAEAWITSVKADLATTMEPITLEQREGGLNHE